MRDCTKKPECRSRVEGKRAVFVKSGPIDTDDKEHWRKLLHIHALMDQFVIQCAGPRNFDSRNDE